MSDDWRLRPFQPGDEPGICRLLERGFGRRHDEAAWQWKLEQQPSPVANVWLAVDQKDRPIFHYGGIPRSLRLAGEERDVMVAVDSVTDPDFRHRGILTAGVRAAHRAWTAAGFACVLGLPNEQWGSRVQALGWQPLFPLKWLIRPLRPGRLLARRLQIPALGRLELTARWRHRRTASPHPTFEIQDVERVEDVGALAAPRESKDLLMLTRDRAWLDWRYLACPNHPYRVMVAKKAGQLVGHLAYRFDRESHVGFIAELLTRAADDDARRALAVAAVRRLSDLGAVAVTTLAVPGSPLYRSLRRASFFPRRRSFLVHCVPLAGDFALEALSHPEHWWLQGGDFDVI